MSQYHKHKLPVFAKVLNTRVYEFSLGTRLSSNYGFRNTNNNSTLNQYCLYVNTQIIIFFL